MTEDAARDLPGWRDLLRERFVALDVRTGDEPRLRGQVRAHAVGPLAVATVASVEQTVRRTPRLIDRHGEDCLQVGLIRAGEALLEQDGRRARILPGTFAVYDTTRPFTWSMPGPWRMDVFTWSRADVPVDRRRIPALTARPAGHGATALVAGAALTQLATLEHAVGGVEGAQLSGRVADLVLAAVGHEAPAQPLLQDVLDLIELRLDDPGLTPETIARACHLSLRSLHRLFADQPRSVARWIRFRRLEQARAELQAHPARPVALVAARYHFADATSFARAFRAEFGVTPSEARDLTHPVRTAHIGPAV